MPRYGKTARASIDWKRCVAMGFCAALFCGSAARAQVMEIGADGSIAVRSGPAVYLTADLKPVPIHATAQPKCAARPQPEASVKDAIETAAANYRISPVLVSAVAWRESRFDNMAVSPKGARGVMQLMPQTAAMLHVDARTASQNIDGGAAYLSLLLNRFHGDVISALAAYNAGPDAVERYGGVPPYRETRSYVDAILDRMSMMANAQ